MQEQEENESNDPPENALPALKENVNARDGGKTVVQDWRGLWREFSKLPGQAKLYVGIGAWLALSILSFTIFGFIVGAFGIVLIHSQWPDLVTHLRHIEQSRRGYRDNGYASSRKSSAGQDWQSEQASNEDLAASQDWQSKHKSDEGLAASQGWQSERASNEDSIAEQSWHGEHTSDEGVVARQSGQAREHKRRGIEGLRQVARADRDAAKKNEQPDDLLREARQMLKRTGRGTSYEDSEIKAQAMSLLRQITGKYPDSKESKKAQMLMEKLRGY